MVVCRARKASAAMALLLLLPTVAAQLPGIPSDAGVASLNVPSLLVLDAGNVITARLQNSGGAPSAVRYVLEAAPEDRPSESFVIQSAVVLVASHGFQNVSTTWSGRLADGRVAEHLVVRIRVEAQGATQDVNPADNQLSVVRDLRIHAFSLAKASSPPNAPMAPATGGSWFVDVTNLGNADDTAILSLLDSTAGWGFELSAAQIELPLADPVRLLVVRFSVPEDAPVGAVGRANVTVASPEGLGRQVLALATPGASTAGLLGLTADAEEQEIRPGAENRLPFTLHNRRSQAYVANLTVEAPAGSSTPSLRVEPSGNQSLAAHEDRVLHGVVVVPSSQPPGQLSWTIRATPVGLQGGAAVLDLRAVVMHVHKVSIGTQTMSLEPGMANEVCFPIRNQGNGDDTIVLRLAEAPVGWTAAPGGPITLTSGQLRTGCLHITIPGSAPAGEQPIRITATYGPDDKVAGATTMPAKVVPRAVGRLVVDAPTLPVSGGETANFTVHAFNDGNAAGTFQFEMAVVDEEGQPSEAPGWILKAAPASRTLGPGQAVDLWVSAKAPAELPEPSSFLTLRLTLTGSGARPAPPLMVSARPAYADLAVSINGTVQAQLYRGVAGDLMVTVTNVGTLASPANVRFKATFQDTAVAGSAGRRPEVVRTIPAIDWHAGARSVSFAIPMPTDADGFRVQVTIDALQQVAEGSESNNVAEQTFTLFRFGVTVRAPADATALPGQTVDLLGDKAFLVRNNEPHAERVVVSFRDGRGWANPAADGPLAFDLAPAGGTGDSRLIPFRVKVPTMPGTDALALRLDVRQATVPLNASATWRLSIDDREAPSIGALEAPVTVPLGGQAEFTTSVSDAVGIKEVTLVVIDATGQVRRTPMEQRGEGSYSVEVGLSSAGRHTAFVEAVDATTRANRADSRANPVLVHVVPASGLSLQVLAPKEGEPVRPGQPVVVSVLSTNGVAAASAVIGGANRQLQPGTLLQVPTDGLQDGLHDIIIRAWDAYNGSAQATVRLRVDAIAPHAGLVRLDPAQPRPGERVTVSVNVTDPSGVREVRLQYSGPGTPGKVVVLEQVVNGTYSAQFLYPRGATDVVLVATDIVGNVATHDQVALHTSSAQKAASPAWLALAALALVFARRRA